MKGESGKNEYNLWLSQEAKEALETLSKYDGVAPNEIIRRAAAITGLIQKEGHLVDTVLVGKCESRVSEEGYLLPSNDGKGKRFNLKVFDCVFGISPGDLIKMTGAGYIYRVSFSDKFLELTKKIDPDLSHSILKSLWNYYVIRGDMARSIDQSVTFFSGDEGFQISFPPIQQRYVGR